MKYSTGKCKNSLSNKKKFYLIKKTALVCPQRDHIQNFLNINFLNLSVNPDPYGTKSKLKWKDLIIWNPLRPNKMNAIVLRKLL